MINFRVFSKPWYTQWKAPYTIFTHSWLCIRDFTRSLPAPQTLFNIELNQSLVSSVTQANLFAQF